MAEGKKRHDLIRIIYRVVLADGLSHPCDIPVGQHGPLWRAGCARGVYEDREIFRGDLFHAVLEQIWLLFHKLPPRLQDVIKGHNHGVLKMPQPF